MISTFRQKGAGGQQQQGRENTDPLPPFSKK
jgi:hypothetical protein